MEVAPGMVRMSDTRNAGAGIIAALRTPVATLVVLVAALLAQLPHAADVFRLVVHGDGLWQVVHSYSYAIALELAVLLFVVQRRNIESYLFAAVSICVNLAYYSLHGVNLFSVAALPAWLISIALPAAIARYSHLIVDAGIAQDDDAEPTADDETAQDFTQTAVQDDAPTDNVPAPQPKRKPARKREVQKLTPEQRRMQIAESGIDNAADVATLFGVSMRTAQADIAATRNAVVQVNGTVLRLED